MLQAMRQHMFPQRPLCNAPMQTPPLVPFPDLTSPKEAFPLYDPPGIERHLVARISDLVR